MYKKKEKETKKDEKKRGFISRLPKPIIGNLNHRSHSFEFIGPHFHVSQSFA